MVSPSVNIPRSTAFLSLTSINMKPVTDMKRVGAFDAKTDGLWEGLAETDGESDATTDGCLDGLEDGAVDGLTEVDGAPEWTAVG